MDKSVDSRRPSPHQMEMAMFQARNVSYSRLGSAVLVANARSSRQLEERIKALEKVKDVEIRKLNWEQSQLRKSPSLKHRKLQSRSMDFTFMGRQSSTHLDGIASPMLNRRCQTSHPESRLYSPSISGSPVHSRRSSAKLPKQRQSLDVLPQDRKFRRSMPNLMAINDETVRPPPRKLSAHLRPTTLAANQVKDSSLKSRSETSLHVLGSPVSRVRALGSPVRVPGSPVRVPGSPVSRVRACSDVNQHGKPISKSWTQLSHSEDTSSS